eukprot:5849350-Pyramimonas_sp.AAC.1
MGKFSTFPGIRQLVPLTTGTTCAPSEAGCSNTHVAGSREDVGHHCLSPSPAIGVRLRGGSWTDREAGLLHWEGHQLTRTKLVDRAEHGGSTHAQGTHGGQGGNPMKDTHTDARASGRPPSQRKKM